LKAPATGDRIPLWTRRRQPRGQVGRQAMGKRILVVECGVPVVPFEQSLLLRKEHDVHRASSGQEACEKVEDLEPNLIILDAARPESSCWAATSARRPPRGSTASCPSPWWDTS
jgi:CheY-like chemotaxis protein